MKPWKKWVGGGEGERQKGKACWPPGKSKGYPGHPLPLVMGEGPSYSFIMKNKIKILENITIFVEGGGGGHVCGCCGHGCGLKSSLLIKRRVSTEIVLTNPAHLTRLCKVADNGVH